MIKKTKHSKENKLRDDFNNSTELFAKSEPETELEPESLISASFFRTVKKYHGK